MNTALDALFTVSSSWALSTIVKATLVAALGLCAALAASRARAAFRYAMLATTFGVLLALPVISAVAPPIAIALRSAQARVPARPLAVTRAPAASAAAPRPGDLPAGSRRPIAEAVTAVWIVGMAAFLLPVGAGLRQVLRLRRSGLPWPQGQRIATELAAGAGVRRPVEVLLHEGLAGPMACGVVRPAILFPVDAAEWGREDLDRALVHELEHVKRSDWAVHCVTRAVCAVYWFHPLVWMAQRRLELEAERACDDAVLARSEPTAYADQLVALARRLSSAATPPLPAMASRADLGLRVNAVLDGARRRGRAGVVSVALMTATAAALVIGVSPLRMVAAPQQAGAGTPQLRTESKLVMTQVAVTYPNGNTVEGLAASDFQVMEDGVAQAIRICEFHKMDAGGYYLLGYYPRNTKADGQFRKIEVTVKTATAAHVEHREGYFMNDPPGIVESRTTGLIAIPPYDRAPVLIFKKEPDYSDAARKAKYQGTVLLYADIDETGLVANLKVVRSLGLGLDEKAIEAVKQWRFRPATKDGKPLAVGITLEVAFRLL